MDYFKDLTKLVNQYVQDEKALKALKENKPELPERPLIFENENDILTYEKSIQDVKNYEEKNRFTLECKEKLLRTTKHSIKNLIGHQNIWYKITTSEGNFYLRIKKAFCDAANASFEILNEKDYTDMNEEIDRRNKEFEELEGLVDEVSTEAEGEKDWHWYQDEVGTNEDSTDNQDYIVSNSFGTVTLHCYSAEYAIELTKVLNKCTIPEY